MFFVKITILMIIFADSLLVLGIVTKRSRREKDYRVFLDKVEKYNKMIKNTLNSKGSGILTLENDEIIKERKPIKKALLSCIEETTSYRRKKRLYKIFRDTGLADYYFKGMLSNNHIVRARAIEVLGDFRIYELTDHISRALNGRSDIEVSASARALGKLGGDKAAEVLVGLMNDPRLVKQSIIISLIEKVGKDAVPHLEKILIFGDESVKIQAAKILGVIGDSQSIPMLVLSLESDNVDLKAKAAEALGKLKAVSCLSHLHNLASSGDWPVRSMAAKALGYIGHPDSIPFLKLLLTDTEWWVRKDAAISLSKMDQAGEDALIDMLKSLDRFSREMSAAQLRSMGAITKYSVLAASVDQAKAKRAKSILFNFDNAINRSSLSIKVGSKKFIEDEAEKKLVNSFQQVG